MKKQKFNGYETDAPAQLEAVYTNVHVRAPHEFVERITLAWDSLNASLQIPAGEMTIAQAMQAGNRVVRIMNTIDRMMREQRGN